MTEIEDARLKIIKAILNEFPELREKVRKWLQETELSEQIENG